MNITKPGIAWVLAVAGTACGAYVAFLQAGTVGAIGATGAALMSAAGLLGWQSKSPL
jgi:hypothetical protein